MTWLTRLNVEFLLVIYDVVLYCDVILFFAGSYKIKG